MTLLTTLNVHYTGIQAILKSQEESLKLAGQELQFSLLVRPVA